MEIVDISHNDNIATVARKCNLNFRQLALSARQSIKKQSRMDGDSYSQQLDNVVAALVNDVVPNEVSLQVAALDIAGQVSSEVTRQISAADIPQQVADAVTAADIPQQIADALSIALPMENTTTLADFFTEDGCTVTDCRAMRWGNMACIRFSYRLNSTLTVPSNGDIADVTLGTLKLGWRPFDMTNVILDQTRILIGDVDTSGVVKARSANSRGSSYTIDANAVLYASMTLMLGIQ